MPIDNKEIMKQKIKTKHSLETIWDGTKEARNAHHLLNENKHEALLIIITIILHVYHSCLSYMFIINILFFYIQDISM